MNWGPRRLAATATVLAAGAMLAIAGEGALGSPLPAPEALPASLVAVVSHLPVGAGRINKAELRRSLAQQVAATGRPAPGPESGRYAKLREAALGELLDAAWINGQAAEMGIAVTGRQIAAELARIKRQSFEDEADYQDFLKESRFTQRDVRERVELQLLSTRIQERVVRGLKGPRAELEAFEEFVDAYSERWRARTVCAPRVAIDRCSNGPLPAT